MTTAFIYRKSRKINLKVGISCSILCHFLLIAVLICASLHYLPNPTLDGGDAAIKAIIMSPLLLADSSHSSIRSVEKNTDKGLTKKIEKNEVAKLIPEQKKKQSHRYKKYGMKHITEHTQENNIKQDMTIPHLAEQATTHRSLVSRHYANSPSPIYRRPPDYPRQALVMGVEGKVVVRYDVDDNGRVTNIRIVSAKPNTIFNRSVKNAMHFWKYEAKAARDLTITILFNRDQSVKFHNA